MKSNDEMLSRRLFSLGWLGFSSSRDRLVVPVNVLSVSVGLAHNVVDTTGNDRRKAAVGDRAFGFDSFGVWASRKLSNSSSSRSFSLSLVAVASLLLVATMCRAFIGRSIGVFADKILSSDNFGRFFTALGLSLAAFEWTIDDLSSMNVISLLSTEWYTVGSISRCLSMP